MDTLLTNLGLWLVLVLVIPQVTAGNINGVMLGTFALMTLASFEAVTPLPLAAQMWNASREAARRLFEVVDAEPAVSEDIRYSKVDTRSSNIQYSNIEFSHLTFSYPTQSITCASGCYLHRPSREKPLPLSVQAAQERAPLPTCCSVSGIMKSGEIRLGGESLKALDQDEVRKQIALVSQNSYFFNTSIRENLRLARRSISQEEMEAAAQAAQIHEFIMKLPKGYDTLIGEQGLRLSGGERQRLAIARALLKNAPILIFDEPTANLDPLTEKQVLDTLFETMRGKTSLLITHRLVGLENVDEILVMDKGRIVERGRHAELLITAWSVSSSVGFAKSDSL